MEKKDDASGPAPLGFPAVDSDEAGEKSPQGIPATNPGQEVGFAKPHSIVAERSDQIRKQSPQEAFTLDIVSPPYRRFRQQADQNSKKNLPADRRYHWDRFFPIKILCGMGQV